MKNRIALFAFVVALLACGAWFIDHPPQVCAQSAMQAVLVAQRIPGPGGGGPLTETDNFMRASLGGNWTATGGGTPDFAIVSSTYAAHTAAANTSMYWNANAFNGDHSSAITFHVCGGSGDYIGPSIRNSSSANTVYFFYDNTNTFYFVKLVSGSQTVIDTGSLSVADGDILKLSGVGSTFHLTKNGADIGSSPYTDTSIASGGQPGIVGNVNNTCPGVTVWTGSN
jgi:hypothetical protein